MRWQLPVSWDDSVSTSEDKCFTSHVDELLFYNRIEEEQPVNEKQNKTKNSRVSTHCVLQSAFFSTFNSWTHEKVFFFKKRLFRMRPQPEDCSCSGTDSAESSCDSCTLMDKMSPDSVKRVPFHRALFMGRGTGGKELKKTPKKTSVPVQPHRFLHDSLTHTRPNICTAGDWTEWLQRRRWRWHGWNGIGCKWKHSKYKTEINNNNINTWWIKKFNSISRTFPP